MAHPSSLLPQSLTGRVFALYVANLLGFLALGGALFLHHEFTTTVDDAQEAATILSSVVAQTVTDSVVIGDYDTVERTLARAIQRSPFAEARFIDRAQAAIVVRPGGAPPAPAPAWLRDRVAAQLSDINHIVAVGGRDYGVLRFRFAPDAIASPIWAVARLALIVGSLAAALGLAIISLALRRWLGPLDRIRAFDTALQAQPANGAKQLRDAPREIREAVDAFLRAGAQLQEERLTAAVTLNAIADGVVTTDADGRILYLNPAARAMLPAAAGDPVRTQITALLPGAFDGAAASEGLRAWSSRRVEVTAPDGGRRMLETSMSPIVGATGTALGHVLTWRDVTATKVFEDRLRVELEMRREAVRTLHEGLKDILPAESRGRFGTNSDTDLQGVARLVAVLVQEREAGRRALSNQKFALDQHAAVSVADAQGRFTYVNEKLQELTGYTAAELIGQTYRMFSTDAHPRGFYREISDTVSAGRVWHGEVVNRHKSGRHFWTATTIVPWLDDGGRPQEHIAIRTDITRQKLAERALGEARQRELATGHEIQRALLFGSVPTGVHQLAVATYSEPSQGIDGDFFAFTEYSRDCLEVLVGDVMGKGVPAALIGAAVRINYSSVVTRLLATSVSTGELPAPAQIMNALHERVTPQLVELGSFVTVALYRIDLARGTLTLVNAGHTPALLIAGDGQVRPLLGDNLPLGVMEDERYNQFAHPLAPGDTLAAYSDGITEARDPQGAEFGEERVHAAFAREARMDLPVGIQLQRVRQAVRAFAAGRAMADDQTAVLVRVQPGGPPSLEDRGHGEEFLLPWHASGLAPLRHRVGEAAGALGADAADRLVLAAFEAATNVVRHVAPPFPDATLSCRIANGPSQVTVELWYLGPPFERPAELSPDLSGESEGGFGLYIIDRAVSRVDYDTPAPGVCCTRLTQQAAAADARAPLP